MECNAHLLIVKYKLVDYSWMGYWKFRME